MITLEQIKKLAIRHSSKGMLPSVFAAQAVLESGYSSGGSTLARNYNNYFGIKAGNSWPGEKVYLNTKEEIGGVMQTVKEPFRVYKSPEDSFEDRAELLLSLSRYKAAYTESTPEAQARALQQAGYATDSNYSQKVIQVINRYNLTQLDQVKMKTKNLSLGGMVLGALILTIFAYIYLTQ